MTLEQANRIIKETSGEVPFNTFTCILEAAGLPHSDLLGGNCVYHARRLLGALEKADPIEAEDDYRHWGVRFRDSGDLFFADSSIGMMEAVNITQLLSDGKAIFVDAFPVLHGEPSKVVFLPNIGGRVKVIQEVQTKPKHFVCVWTFDPHDTHSLPPIGDLEIPSRNKRELHLKVFAPKGEEGESWVTVDTVSLQPRLTVFGSNGIEQRQTVSDAFAQVQRIAEKVGHDPQSLLELMKDCARVRREVLWT